jgi:hypothetical protein
MLMPDVTEILDDPEIGGGEPFQVQRVKNNRSRGHITRDVETIEVTGNIQPQDRSSQPSTAEDLLNEGIVIYACFEFRTGRNDGSPEYVGADEILYDGNRYRVTRVDNWSKWGFSIAYATKVMDVEEVV